MEKIKDIIHKINSNQKTLVDTSEWKEFRISDFFEIYLAKPYHKLNLQITNNYTNNAIVHISRTAFNNGIDCYVIPNNSIKIEDGNAITLGAEGNTFFYQSKPFICGNKVSVIRHVELNKNIAIYLCAVFNISVKNKYNYNNALTFGRLIDCKFELPFKNNQPDWNYMDNYIENLRQKMHLGKDTRERERE